MHGNPGEQASEAPSTEILHRETGDKIFGERLGANSCLCSCSSSLICVLIIKSLHHGRQPWWSCCCVSDLPDHIVRDSNLILGTSYGSICRSARCLCMSTCG
jgi:hypothetical protein